MKAEEVFRFTAAQRAELEGGWVAMLADQEAAEWSAAIREAAPVLVDRAARAGRRPRSRIRRAYDYAARFAGPLLIATVVGSTGAAIILAFVSAR
ncbi:hypothetical protein [Streptomyces sp. 3211]|uniref:hypothetical protein n=1 Tax=Streptomyces sp. 3211 TaxID=1964449 RepID=UPI0009A54F00|nr:hypothetical protein [Streptomyces sp. 3211]